MFRALSLLAVFASLPFASGPAAASPILTGLVEFSTDSSGTFDAISFWNTMGAAGRGSANIYVVAPNAGINGPFLNSGDGAGASISQALTFGTNRFYFFGEPGLDSSSFFGLNLFFDGNNSTPGISVFALRDDPPSPPFPPFAANMSSSTPTLDLFSTTPAAGSLSYTSGGFVVTLTDYRWSAPSVEGLNRVQYFENTPGGADDYVGSFTLQVTAVPEPSGLVSAVLGLAGLAGYAGWRRARPRRPLSNQL